MNCKILWGFVVDFYNNHVILINLKHGTGGLSIDKEHLPGEAIGGVVLPCYGKVKLLGLERS
ncbi:unnamed protein product [Fusarium graminearum]|nr:unnamed protein product [Fusarium graminearum]